MLKEIASTPPADICRGNAKQCRLEQKLWDRFACLVKNVLTTWQPEVQECKQRSASGGLRPDQRRLEWDSSTA